MQIFHSRSLKKLWVTATATLALLTTTVQSAHACISHCIHHYGNLTEVSPNVWWELSHCTQTETMNGPVVIYCYYVVHDYSHVPPN